MKVKTQLCSTGHDTGVIQVQSLSVTLSQDKARKLRKRIIRMAKRLEKRGMMKSEYQYRPIG